MPDPSSPLAWGARVSPAFREKARAIAAELGCDPSDLMACMAWESGRSFRADVKNMAGSGAVGLIQFMPSTASGLGTTTEALEALTAEDQLDWVRKYFAPWRGRLHSVADLYMAILWPLGVGKPDDYVLFDVHDQDHPARYRQNAGLDIDHNGKVTKAEAAAKVIAMRAEGLRPLNVR
jgi:hypothetical protein